MGRKLNVLPVRTFLSRGVTGVKCAHAPHFQPNCHFPQNFAFRRNKAASDFRTQGERELDLGPCSSGSITGKKGFFLQNAQRQQLLAPRSAKEHKRQFFSGSFSNFLFTRAGNLIAGGRVISGDLELTLLQ